MNPREKMNEEIKEQVADTHDADLPPMGPEPYVDPKVTAGTLGGAGATVLFWAMEEFTSVDMPLFIAVAIVTLIMGGIGFIKKN